MGSLDRQRWDALWQRLGGNPPADAFDALLAAYGGADRHYHSDRHILACLEHFDRWRQLARRPDLVELALWTHDLVYDTQRQDNEAASAASTERWLDQAGLAALRPALRELIMATCHQAPPGDADAALVVDLDLDLAAPAPVYARYEADVRAEYAWVPEPLFRAGRAVAAPVAGATGAVPLRTAAAALGGRRPRQPARCPGAPGTAGLSRTGKFLRAA